jgi:hypothetical protein
LGILPPDPEMADRYRRNAKEDPVQFDEEIQKVMIDETLIAATFQRFGVDHIATDQTHLHVLDHWDDARTFERIRDGLRSSHPGWKWSPERGLYLHKLNQSDQ